MVVCWEEQLERVFSKLPKFCNVSDKEYPEFTKEQMSKYQPTSTPYSTKALLTAVAVAAAVEDQQGQLHLDNQRKRESSVSSEIETASTLTSDDDAGTAGIPKPQEATGIQLDQTNSTNALMNIPKAGRSQKIKARKSSSGSDTTASSANTCKKAASKRIARPFNSFILYRMDKQTEITRQKPGLNHKVVSCLVADAWRNESEEIKAVYRQKAEQYKQNHRKLYPEWKLVRRSKRSKRHTADHSDADDGSKTSEKSQEAKPLSRADLNTSTVVTTVPLQPIYHSNPIASQIHPQYYSVQGHTFPVSQAPLPGPGSISGNGSGQPQQAIYFYTPAVMPAQFSDSKNVSNGSVAVMAGPPVYAPQPSSAHQPSYVLQPQQVLPSLSRHGAKMISEGFPRNETDRDSVPHRIGNYSMSGVVSYVPNAYMTPVQLIPSPVAANPSLQSNSSLHTNVPFLSSNVQPLCETTNTSPSKNNMSAVEKSQPKPT